MSGACDCTTTRTGVSSLAPDSGPGRATYRIENMDCPTEEALIRSKLSNMPGIADMRFDLLRRTLTLTHAADALPIALPPQSSLLIVVMNGLRLLRK